MKSKTDLKVKIISEFNFEEFCKFLTLLIGEKEISKLWIEAYKKVKKEDDKGICKTP